MELVDTLKRSFITHVPPEEYFDDEFKKIDLVWLLNLCPPGAGIGTLYACGPGAAFFLLFVWAYLIIHHASWEPLLQAYMITSIVGTLGCILRNMKLQKYLDNLPAKALEADERDNSLVSSSLTLASVLKVEEKESVEPDTILLKSEPDQKEKVSTALKIEEVLKETVAEEDQSVNLDEPKEQVEFPELESEEVIQIQTEEIQSEDEVESPIEKFDETEVEEVENDEELVKEREQLMNKLASATGEYQPELKEPNEYEGFSFSQIAFEDSFNFEIPQFSFEKALSANEKVSEANLSHCQCGAQVDTNFSFCLACGKNF